MADPVIRNLRITQAYHELSAATAARVGPVATWCTYATWASKQAGRTIRKEDLRSGLEAALRSSPDAAPRGARCRRGPPLRLESPGQRATRVRWRAVDPRGRWIGRAPRLRGQPPGVRGDRPGVRPLRCRMRPDLDQRRGQPRPVRAGAPARRAARWAAPPARGVPATIGRASRRTRSCAPSSCCLPTSRSASMSRPGSSRRSRRRSTRGSSTPASSRPHRRGPVPGRRLARSAAALDPPPDRATSPSMSPARPLWSRSDGSFGSSSRAT